MINLDEDYLSPEHREFRLQLRRFIDSEIRDHADAWDTAGVPASVFVRMGSLGFLGATLPVAQGGSGLGAFGTIVLGEELGRSGSGGFGAAVSAHADIVAPLLARIADEAIQREVLPDVLAGIRLCALAVTEPGGGSDLVRMQTSATRDGDDYVLKGQKTFITNAVSAHWFVVVARSNPEAKGGSGFTAFLVEKGTPGLEVGENFRKTGWLASSMSDVFLDDCRVPASRVLGQIDRGFYHMMSGIEHERLSIAAQCIGMIERALELTLAWLKGRPAYGKTLWDLQSIRHTMAGLISEFSASKALVYHTAGRLDRGHTVRLETTMIKASVPELLKRLVDKCVQFHGAHGYMRESEIERIWRDTRPHSLGGGASEVMLDEVAKLI